MQAKGFLELIATLSPLPVKQEPTPPSPSQTGLKVNLPATPKSSNGDKAEDSTDHQTGAPESMEEGGESGNKQGHDERQTESDSRAAVAGQQDMEVDQTPEERHFVLAPTPAQLGKAPLQRRLASSCSQDSSKDLSPTELPHTTTASSSSFSGMFAAAVATPTATTTMDEPPPTSANSKKKQFFKKAKNDDMDT